MALSSGVAVWPKRTKSSESGPADDCRVGLAPSVVAGSSFVASLTRLHKPVL